MQVNGQSLDGEGVSLFGRYFWGQVSVTSYEQTLGTQWHFMTCVCEFKPLYLDTYAMPHKSVNVKY